MFLQTFHNSQKLLKCQTFLLTRLQSFRLHFFCESYKVFKNTYFTEHLGRVTASVFCIFFCNFDYFSKSFGCLNPYQYILYCYLKNVKIPSMPSPVWSSSKTIWNICPISKRPPRHSLPVYADYFFSCDYDDSKALFQKQTLVVAKCVTFFARVSILLE